MSKNIVPMTLRLPVELHKELKELAEIDNRSLHNFIITTLEKEVHVAKG